ncbi:hypothetical protein TSUD_148590 [Trifolium subterraneum]|uniref:Uncharacterized protein n=1 Tax=Trifolium subterraneum TaxID=3900 RepID=A0A2Z6MMZ5_TRISU|nr:hypothetical protein TSUD_148590 [Trifolium subterraneum]
MFGSRATIPSNTAPGYMTWYFKIPHPYIVPIPAGQSVMHAESGDGVLGRLASIRDILNDLIISDEVPNGSHVYKELELEAKQYFLYHAGKNNMPTSALVSVSFALQIANKRVFAFYIGIIGVFVDYIVIIEGVH